MIRLEGTKGSTTGTGASMRMSQDDGLLSSFTPEDYRRFDDKLKAETEQAIIWGKEGAYDPMLAQSLGCEIEGTLIDIDGNPVAQAEAFMDYLSSSNGYYEMSQYNVEFEIEPIKFNNPMAFANLHDHLTGNQSHISRCADMIDSYLVMCGMLPTLKAEHFSDEVITKRHHFQTLNRQLQKLNGDNPFEVNIGYGEGAHFAANNLSIEGAAASLQVHLGVSEGDSAAIYNASQLVSAITLGVSANSPFLMGKRLWAETRIPLFEQIMHQRFVGKNESGSRRCNHIFGDAYLEGSILDLFLENYSILPTILPIVRDTPVESMLHLILHNRDILRWNRPVLGFIGSRPFLRIEHRVMPVGPTLIDMVANIAFYVGLVNHLRRAFTGSAREKTIQRMPFSAVYDNFYNVARQGMESNIMWLGENYTFRDFVLQKALEYARRGLESIRIADGQINEWLGIIEQRVAKNQNGSVWQQRYIEKYGNSEETMCNMIKNFRRLQDYNAPVHTWKV